MKCNGEENPAKRNIGKVHLKYLVPNLLKSILSDYVVKTWKETLYETLGGALQEVACN